MVMSKRPQGAREKFTNLDVARFGVLNNSNGCKNQSVLIVESISHTYMVMFMVRFVGLQGI